MEFTGDQNAVIVAPDNRLVVSAVAGSGKTTTMVERLLGAIATGRPADECLAVTFTRAAAAHVRNKIKQRLGAEILATTIHGLCLRILEEHAPALFDRGIISTPFFQVASNWEIDRLKAEAQEEIKTTNPIKIKALVNRRLTERGLIRIEDLLSLGTIALANLDSARKWSFVIVDEAQDLNEAQWGVIESLQAESLTIVGDHAQALYEWNGARPDLFEAKAREWTTLHMTTNWRCRPEIVDLANNHLASMKVVTEPMVTPPGAAELRDVVMVEMFPDEAEEITAAAEMSGVLAQRDDTVGILARYRTQVDQICQAIGGLGIPFWTPSSNQRIWSSAISQLAVTGLRALCLKSEPDLERLVTDVVQDAADILQKAKAAAMDSERTLHECLRETAPDLAWWKFADEMDGDMSIIAACEYLNFPPVLVAALLEWCETQPEAEPTVQQFVRNIAFEGQEDGIERAPVCVSTIHGAKGLEWDSVIVTGMNEGRIPGRGGNEDEERRLFYVAITRARERLILTSHGIGASLDGRPEFHKPSRFLSETGLWDDSRIIRP
jgi:superfamily I DNA/RNA helicase